VIIIFKNKMI